MTATATPTRRKQLSEQLDRFEALLDGLAEGLNEAVADAAREGARAAVREVLTTLLTDPEVLAAIHPAANPEPAPPAPRPTRPSVWTRLRSAAVRIADRMTEAAGQGAAAVRMAVRPAGTVIDLFRMTGTLRRTLAVAAAAAAAAGVGLVTLTAPDWVAAAVSATAGAAPAIAVQAGATLRSLLARLRPA
jgi:hypothetical protein